MDLIINNQCIDAPLDVILNTLRREINTGKLRDILPEDKDNITITCPKHKGGHERNASCKVYTKRDNDNVEFGKCHCFTCNYSATLPQLVRDCFEETDESFGEEWLIERFGIPYSQNVNFLSDIEIKPKKRTNKVMNETILNQFAYYHPYMWQRKLSKDVVHKFRIGYSHERNSLVFPVRYYDGKLAFLTYRNVTNKNFYIQENAPKLLYLLDYAIKQSFKSIIITEAQIDALTAYTYGYPAIATIGSLSYEQIDMLNRCGIRHYILMFDNDEYGKKFSNMFKNNIRKDVFVTEVGFPLGKKDINDLSKDEFNMCLDRYNITQRLDSNLKILQ